VNPAQLGNRSAKSEVHPGRVRDVSRERQSRSDRTEGRSAGLCQT
jgi:hypothetical protein